MSECFAHIEYFLDNFINYLDQCIENFFKTNNFNKYNRRIEDKEIVNNIVVSQQKINSDQQNCKRRSPNNLENHSVSYDQVVDKKKMNYNSFNISNDEKIIENEWDIV